MSFEEATFAGLAPDGGLFMPQKIPRLSKRFFSKLPGLSFQEIALEVAHAMLGDAVPKSSLRKIVEDAINFKAPLIPLHTDTYILELFHGPTLSFKDFGARFMAELFSYFADKSQKQLTILTATSGDTGSAVAHGFFRIPNVRVIVLYPKDKISHAQESQIATLGHNITALAVRGTFDDCQRLVKQALNDIELKKHVSLTSANSINVARLIPQTFYYFWAYAQLQGQKRAQKRPIVFSVPSGNFGNLTAGLIAKRMGLPIEKFIAATNRNSSVPHYLKTGSFIHRAVRPTLSSAMDVANPSNFARILDLYGSNLGKMRKDVWGASFTDKQTLVSIRTVFQKYRYVLEPHGAVGYLGLEKYRKENEGDAIGVVFETAHPAKFPETVKKAIGIVSPMPYRLKKCLTRKKKSQPLQNNFLELRALLLKL